MFIFGTRFLVMKRLCSCCTNVRECPLDLKEAISSVCFAAPRCADLPELIPVQILFAGKYGKEFVIAATELLPECGVNRQLVELLSVRAPAPDVKLELLKEIAEEHQLDWDPSASESELLKTHEDLLNGPTQFVGGSKLALPGEKHNDTAPEPDKHEKSDSDSDFDIVEFPEVPTQPLQPYRPPVSTPVMLHFPESGLSDVDDQDEANRLDPEEDTIRASCVEAKQFVPFISPPPQPSETGGVREHIPMKDLQDVLAAARAAAESAERAAAAARSAASIAQLRISELSRKRSNEFPVPNAAGNQDDDG